MCSSTDRQMSRATGVVVVAFAHWPEASSCDARRPPRSQIVADWSGRGECGCKVLLVLFMVVMGWWHSSSRNLLDPYVPPAGANSAGQPAYGWEGVLRGTAMAFFGFVGFDEVRRRVMVVALAGWLGFRSALPV